jgi:hypothetical protein
VNGVKSPYPRGKSWDEQLEPGELGELGGGREVADLTLHVGVVSERGDEQQEERVERGTVGRAAGQLLDAPP